MIVDVILPIIFEVRVGETGAENHGGAAFGQGPSAEGVNHGRLGLAGHRKVNIAIAEDRDEAGPGAQCTARG